MQFIFRWTSHPTMTQLVSYLSDSIGTRVLIIFNRNTPIIRTFQKLLPVKKPTVQYRLLVQMTPRIVNLDVIKSYKAAWCKLLIAVGASTKICRSSVNAIIQLESGSCRRV